MKSGLFDDLIEQPTESPSEATYQSKSGLFQDEVTQTPDDYYTKPVATPVLTQVEPVKPTFKTFSDLTFGEKAKLSTAKVTKGWYGGSLGAVAGLIQSVSTGKDFLKGAFTSSTISEELAKDTTFDKNVKKLASLYSNQADITSDELKNTKISLGVNPDDTFVDQLFQGTGYLTNFIATGVPTKMATMAIGFGKYAGAVANSFNIASESLMEAQDVYKEAKANGKSDMEAYEATRNTLASNALLIGLTNKFSGVFEDTAFKGIKRMFKVGASGTVEGLQEGLQQMVSNYNTDKPLFQGVKESFLIGASLGVPMAVAFDTGSKQGKEEVQKIIDESPATEEQKQVATDILNGVATEEQKQAVFAEAVANETLSVPVDETNKEALREDIQGMVAQGANIGDIVIALQAEGISQNDAENIVAEVIATPEATAVVEEVVKPKATPKKVVTTTDLKAGTEFENVGTLQSITQPKSKGKKKGSVKYYFKHADGVQKYYTEKQALELVRKGYKPAKPRVERAVPQVVDKAKQYGFDNVQYYFDNTDAPETVSYYDNNEKDYVGYRTSTVMVDFPEHLRDRKLLNEVEEYWYKQTRPEDTGTQASKNRQELYDYLAKQVDNFAKDYNKKLDEQMSQKANGDNIEFKTKQSTASREMAVLDDFKKRYKVQFPTLIVDKIIQGQKTKLSADRTGLAEGVTDGNTIAIAFDAVVNTAKHELVHLTLNNLDQIPELARFSREDILKAQAEKMGEKFTENKAKDIEEQLALDFEAYQNKTYKPNNNILAKFFASISKMIKDFRNLIVKTDGDVITQYYDAVLYGKTERTQAVEIATESSIAKYLVDNVVDYTPMYTTRRVLSLSNGIKSIDFKSVEEYGMSHRPTKGVPAFDLTALVDGEQMIPEDMYTQWYGSRGTKSDLESIAVLKKVKGDPEASITIYRASPKNEFNRGDWITLSKTYAEEHAEGNNSKVHSKTVKAKDVFWAMDDVNEFGYYPELSQAKFKDALDKSVELYKESGNLTTKILKDLEGKTTVSKQYILDATNRGDVKQVEKDLIRSIISMEGDKVNVKDFAEKVKLELLPLTIKGSDLYVPNNSSFNDPDAMIQEGDFTPKYENIALPTELRGKVANYNENIYESPIPTSAGGVHFNYLTKNYFGHTRIEDMKGDKLRRVIEVQSDLYQKGSPTEKVKQMSPARTEVMAQLSPEKAKRYDELSRKDVEITDAEIQERSDLYSEAKTAFSNKNAGKLLQYNDPTAHFRMIREEIRSATLDGKDVLQFPTGETAMKIEGLGETNTFSLVNEKFANGMERSEKLTPETLKVGGEIKDANAKRWIITKVLTDGKFVAVDKFYVDTQPKNWEFEVDKSVEGKTSWMAINKVTNRREFTEFIPSKKQEALDFLKRKIGADNPDISLEEIGSRHGETFDISGKVDTNNPIYKFYEKEVGRYLKNNYKAETVTDNKGVTWYEVKLKDEYKGAVVAFKERVTRAENEEYIKKTYPKYYEAIRAKLPPQKASRAFDRAKARLQEQFQFDTTYTTVKIADEMAKAMEVVAQNPDYAKKVALGLEEAPLDVTDTAISLAVAESAKEKGDYQLQADSEKERSLRQSRRGQEIVMEKGRVDENSSDYFIKQVLDRRKELIAQKYKPFMKKAKPFLELLDEMKENKIKKNKKIKSELEIKIEDFDNFLMEMAC